VDERDSDEGLPVVGATLEKSTPKGISCIEFDIQAPTERDAEGEGEEEGEGHRAPFRGLSTVAPVVGRWPVR
jgi:hypothetical protein